MRCDFFFNLNMYGLNIFMACLGHGIGVRIGEEDSLKLK